MVTVPGLITSELGLALSPPRVARIIPPVTTAAPTTEMRIHFREPLCCGSAAMSRELRCEMTRLALFPSRLAVTLILNRPTSELGVKVAEAAWPWGFDLVV